jgi:hypothetical protein
MNLQGSLPPAGHPFFSIGQWRLDPNHAGESAHAVSQPFTMSISLLPGALGWIAWC